jgi:hypothetical protein
LFGVGQEIGPADVIEKSGHDKFAVLGPIEDVEVEAGAGSVPL